MISYVEFEVAVAGQHLEPAKPTLPFYGRLEQETTVERSVRLSLRPFSLLPDLAFTGVRNRLEALDRSMYPV